MFILHGLTSKSWIEVDVIQRDYKRWVMLLEAVPGHHPNLFSTRTGLLLWLCQMCAVDFPN